MRGQHVSIFEEGRREGVRSYGVSGIIMWDERVLLVRRREDDFLAGIYEFPGGKVEEGEGLADALIREVREETGLRVSGIGRYLGFFDYDSEEGERRRVFNFQVEVSEPLEIHLKEHDRFVWADEKKLGDFDLSEDILRILKQLWPRREN